MRKVTTATVVMLVFAANARAAKPYTLSGPMQAGHSLTIRFNGPAADEQGKVNPFTDYRLTVRFTRGSAGMVVPGYFAADGRAADSGATGGRCWRVHWVAPQPGRWSFVVSFRRGKNIAVASDEQAGEPSDFNGLRGALDIRPNDDNPSSPATRGVLRWTGDRYLRWAGDASIWLKCGADSPENFLGYAEFDNTAPHGKHKKGLPDGLHHYAPHRNDWRPGDPTWRGGRGKGIIGAVNYLASAGVNCLYMLTMNVNGDGRDVYPWTTYDKDFTRFDCSKLDQWNIVFTHMQRRGIVLHLLTQETENDQLLDGGALGLTRKLYYRELIARFAHHTGLIWNLGEENTNTTAQQKAFAQYIRQLDPYDHPIVLHTFPSRKKQVYTPLLGDAHFDGPSLQISRRDTCHAQTLEWLERSEQAGRPWFVCVDEIGPAHIGARPDADDPTHDTERRDVLWANLMAGGSGVEWYFGYKYPNNDLTCEDFRSRAQLFRQTRLAVDFFATLPLAAMTSHDERVAGDGRWCLAKPGALYLVYLPEARDSATVDLAGAPGDFTVRWFDPRRGGAVQQGSVRQVRGGGKVSLGLPPHAREKDWAVVVRRAQSR